MDDFIISAEHVCKRDSVHTLREWIFKTSHNFRGLRFPYTGKTEGLSVVAVIEGGRWTAACIAPNCNGHEYVSPSERIFYCFSCGNKNNQGHANPVAFPDNWREIESALLARPLVLAPATTEFESIRSASPRIPGLGRWWAPPTTLTELIDQNREAGL